MTFAVLPVLIPEIRAAYDAYFAAFVADPECRRLLEILFPDGFGSDEFRKAHTDGTRAWWNHSETQYTFKCVDTATSEIVGMTLCDIFVKPRSGEERKNPGIGWLQGEQKERCEKVLNPLWDTREKLWGGRQYIYVHAFAVDPKHQGRGAGAALVKALIALSDQSNLPIYLESSPPTEGLYAKLGFQRLKESVIHDAAVLGTDKDVEVPLMVKLPSKAGNVSFEEWAAANP
ncbi:hypothetical protein QBC46DRAFT_394186 [Diplogelasinospora grovesii]|uniref:N-acetyltransferase domain-containing protein n=1 Tax=Diplogelasinospora grovesii TaxID=303347 RepID=A0AAN6N0Z1_9PEZI|nr:hypothetical protein QBC46DRAFT_394186 [Diplogelasinospora grovesii]